jgi:nitrous oxidase accessory protein NosD
MMILALLVSGAASVILTLHPVSSLAQESSDLCGETVSGDLQLTSDITCEGDGITVGGSLLTIFMNGHTISGPGPDSNTTGILVDGGNTVRIRGPGTITGFGIGVAYTDTLSGAMRDILVRNNDVGVLLDGVDSTHVKQDSFSDNRIGIINRDSVDTELENLIMARSNEGLRLENSQSVDLDFNIIMDSGIGISLDEESIDNEIFYNVLFRNQGLDVTVADLGDGTLRNNFGNNDCVRSDPAEICTY